MRLVTLLSPPRPARRLGVTLPFFAPLRVLYTVSCADRPQSDYLTDGDSLGRTVASQRLDFCAEESPGSMDTLPGNAWAPRER